MSQIAAQHVRLTLMTGPERRRRWGDAERLQILEAARAGRDHGAPIRRLHKLGLRVAVGRGAPAAFMPVMLSAQKGVHFS